MSIRVSFTAAGSGQRMGLLLDSIREAVPLTSEEQAKHPAAQTCLLVNLGTEDVIPVMVREPLSLVRVVLAGLSHA